MELYKRVDKVAKDIAGSVSKLAKALGVPQTTFNGHIINKRDDKLLPRVDKILAIYPQIRKDWLFFGTGAMLKDQPHPDQGITDENGNADIIAELRNKLAECERNAAEDGRTIEFLKTKLAFLEKVYERQTEETIRVTEEAKRLTRTINKLSESEGYRPKAANVQEEIMESSSDYGPAPDGTWLQESSKKFEPDTK